MFSILAKHFHTIRLSITCKRRVNGTSCWRTRHQVAPCHAIPNSPQGVTAGAGDVTAKAGGSNTVSVLRFSHHDVHIHAGQTVEWDNQDPITPHTITFGPDPTRPWPSFPRRDCRSGWGQARHHPFHYRHYAFGVHHRGAARTAWASSGPPGRDTFQGYFPERGDLPLPMRAA